MFGFTQPAHLYVDPLGWGGYVAPEDLYYGRAAPFGFVDRELPCACPACSSEGLFDACGRPCSRVYQHPTASQHRRPQQHPFCSVSQPQQVRFLRRAHPAAHAFQGSCNNPATAAAAWHPERDVQSLQDAQPEAVLHDASPCAAAYHSGTRTSSSRGSLSSSSIARSYPSSQQSESGYGPGCCIRPTPVLAAAQQEQLLQQQQQQQHAPAYGHLHQQQPASPAASAASSRARLSIPVYADSTQPAAPQPVPVQFVSPASATAAAPPPQWQQVLHRPVRQLTRGEAATVIQSWWRMRRLAGQRRALQALAAAAAQLRSTSSLFQAYKHDSSAAGSRQPAQQRQHINHKQYLELNELAMRVLLALDATSCGLPELRAVRKRLTATAINLLDDIQASYSAAVNASMELSDDLVRSAMQGISKSAAAAADVEQQQQPRRQANSSLALTDGSPQVMQQSSEQCAAAVGEPTGGCEPQPQKQTASSGAQPNTVSAAACGGSVWAVEEACTGLDELAAAQHQHQHHQQLSVLAAQSMTPFGLPADVRVVLVYPGSSMDAATQTD